MEVNITTNESYSVDLTPKKLGELFASMDALLQREFLQGVYEAITKWPSSQISGNADYGAAQWHFLAKDLQGTEHRHARRTLMAMAGSLYKFAQPEEDIGYLWWLEHEDDERLKNRPEE